MITVDEARADGLREPAADQRLAGAADAHQHDGRDGVVREGRRGRRRRLCLAVDDVDGCRAAAMRDRDAGRLGNRHDAREAGDHVDRDAGGKPMVPGADPGVQTVGHTEPAAVVPADGTGQ